MKKTCIMLLLLALRLSAQGAEALSASFEDSAYPQQIAALLKDAEGGDVWAQYLVGFMYEEGQGIQQNDSQAFWWYTQAARQGHTDAQFALGQMYADGRGVPQDRSQAIDWYTQAARQGSAPVQLLLSMMVADPQAADPNLTQAYMWALLAERNGVDASESKAWLVPRMTARQILAAEKMAREFEARFPDSVHNPVAAQGGLGRHCSPEDGFTVDFPSPPRRTLLQDDSQVAAIHYESETEDEQVRYHISIYRFKENHYSDRNSQDTFIEDYLAVRAVVSEKGTFLRRPITFQKTPAVLFTHRTAVGPNQTIHRGIVFFVEQTFLSLSCIYPSSLVQPPEFQSFLNSFKLRQAASDAP